MHLKIIIIRALWRKPRSLRIALNGALCVCAATAAVINSCKLDPTQNKSRGAGVRFARDYIYEVRFFPETVESANSATDWRLTTLVGSAVYFAYGGNVYVLIGHRSIGIEILTQRGQKSFRYFIICECKTHSQ
jgi:hypothetical protein